MSNTVQQLADKMAKVEKALESNQRFIEVLRVLNALRGGDADIVEAINIVSRSTRELLPIRNEMLYTLQDMGLDTGYQARAIPMHLLVVIAGVLAAAVGFRPAMLAALEGQRAAFARAQIVLEAIESGQPVPDDWLTKPVTMFSEFGSEVGKAVGIALLAGLGIMVLKDTVLSGRRS